MRIVDLFCGCGGFSHGFLSLGTSFVGVDKWGLALETYERNIGGETIESSVEDVSSLGRADILIGSPPCQDFSTANHRRQLDTKLVERYLELRDEIRPKWWVMEEVPAVGKIGEERGWFRARYLQANWFGLPHERKRLFAGNYPTVTPTNVVEVEVGTPIAQIRGYGRSIEQRRILKEYYAKMSGADPNGTFPSVVTPELYAKVMGFPADYDFAGTKYDKYVQIGNAVCPPVSAAICESIKNPPGGGLFS